MVGAAARNLGEHSLNIYREFAGLREVRECGSRVVTRDEVSS